MTASRDFLVEIGTEDEIYGRPTHPYTQALLSAVPVPDPTMRGKRAIIRLDGFSRNAFVHHQVAAPRLDRLLESLDGFLHGGQLVG